MIALTNFARRFSRPDFASFVFLFSALACLCVALFTFHPRYDGGFHEYYLFALAMAGLLAAGTACLLPAEEQKHHRPLEWLFVLLIFLFGLGLGLYRIDNFSIWLDEEVQANATFGWYRASVVSQVAYSQQMPLNYFFTALSWSLLGLNELALRLPACIFVAGSGPLFYRLAKRVCANRLIYSSAPFIFLICPWIIRYAQEGRGYGCLLFCAMLWMNAAYDLITAPAHRAGLIRSWLIFTSCTLFLQLSVSFQPVLFTLSFVPGVLGLCLLPNWRRNARAFLAGLAVSLILVAPLILLAQSHSQSYFHELSTWSALSRPLKNMLAVPSFVNSLFLGQSAFLALVVFFAPFTFTRPVSKAEGTLWFGIGAAFIFMVAFFGLFALLINYMIFTRYYLILYPLGLLIIFAYFDHVTTFFDQGRDRYLIWLWQLAFLAALAAPPLRSLPDVYHSKKFDRWNIDHRAIYHYLRKIGQPNDLAYVIPYKNPETWELNGFLAKQFYYQENSPVALKSNWEFNYRETVSDQILADAGLKGPRQVFLAFFELGPAQEKVRAYCSSRAGTKIIGGEDFLICSFSAKETVGAAIEVFLAGLVRFTEGTENAYRMYDILLRLAERDKNSSGCKNYLADLKKLKSASPSVTKILQFHEEKCLALKTAPR